MEDDELDVLRACGFNIDDILQPISLNKIKEKKAIRKTKRALTFIDKYFESLVNKSEEQIPILYTSRFDKTETPLLHEALYAYHALSQKQMKIQSLTQSFYATASTAISLLGSFLSKKLKSHVYYRCYYKRLPQMVQKLYLSNETIVKIKHHILCLDNYLKRNFNTCKRFPAVTIAQLNIELENSLKKVNLANEYCKLTPFDTYFDIFVLDQNDIFEEAAIHILHSKIKVSENARRESFHLPKSMSKSQSSDIHEIKEKLKKMTFDNQYTLNLSPIMHLTSHVCNILNIKSTDANFIEKFLIIKCAVLRNIFDRIYSIMPNILKEESDIATRHIFENKCSLIRSTTPRILKISTSVIRKDLMDYPFTSLVKMSSDLQAASMNLQMIQFLTNPLDIIDLIYQAIKCIEKFVDNSSNDIKSGQVHKDQSKKAIPKVNTMSFDDFFSLFWPLFALNPIGNCLTVASLLTSVTNYSISSPFDFVKLLYVSAVEYTQTVNLKELIPLHLLDQSPKDLLDLSIM